MDKAWFREKLADKILLGLIATCISTLAFGLYELSSQKIANAQKNADVQVLDAKANFQALKSALDDAIVSLELNARNVINDEKLQTSIAKLRIVSKSVNSAFSGDHGVSDQTFSDALKFCSKDILGTEFDLEKVVAGNAALSKLSETLEDCERKLVPSFARYLAKVVDESFDATTKRYSVHFFGFYISLPILFNFGILLFLGVLSIFIYCRLKNE
nr:hypothetical protein [uncultured Roseibium sp.]